MHHIHTETFTGPKATVDWVEAVRGDTARVSLIVKEEPNQGLSGIHESVIAGVVIRDGNDVKVWGTSGADVTYEGLSGTIDTLLSDRSFKLWPDDGRTEGGKVWFSFANITRIEVFEDGTTTPD